jgi:RNA polymerase sigma factor (sigma-70 family)
VRTYLNKAMGQLAAELAGGLMRLRRSYVDNAEALLGLIRPDQQYPYDFVVYRLTGFRPPQGDPSRQPMIPGRQLRADLQRLMLDVCDSFELRPQDYGQRVYDAATLASRFRISTKTIQRWRRLGLPARRMVFDHGRRRVAFLESSLRAFARSRRQRIMRSVRFSQLSPQEKADIIRRARRMARYARCSLMEISRRIAAATGRAVETVRYTIRRHDLANPQSAVLPYLAKPLDEQARSVVYQCFLQGVPAATLAQRYGRSRGSIYRVINEMRARQLLSRPIDCIYNQQFDLPGAHELIMVDSAAAMPAAAAMRSPPADLPPYLQSLYEWPLLSPQREHELFRRYNYLKHCADRLRRKIDANHIRAGELRQIEALLLRANAVKNEIVRSNLRLVVSIAKKHLGSGQGLLELVSDGNISLLRAVEKFDFARGYRFSTYATWAIMRNFARSVPRQRYELDRLATGQGEVLDVLAAMHKGGEVNMPELRDSVEALLGRLSPRERMVLVDHYGLDDSRPAQTLDQVGASLGLSKERVRQIEAQAMKKLRRYAAQ